MASIKKRGRIYYMQYYVAGEQYRVSLQTSLLPEALTDCVEFGQVPLKHK